ncbi:MAG TPA: hypothetical protein VFW33_03085 [Gemmataceae bacterium]|nr:hypothetical protein [Gemmataceae bacterium]
MEVLDGRAEPKSPAEGCEWAYMASRAAHQRFAAAVKLYAAAFAADPRLADDLSTCHRYNAACFAARAARGDGTDPPKDETARAALRRQSLAWLRADLAGHTKLARSANAIDRGRTLSRLSHWLEDGDFSALRPGPGATDLPAAEAADWTRLWSEVRARRGEVLKLVGR